MIIWPDIKFPPINLWNVWPRPIKNPAEAGLVTIIVNYMPKYNYDQ